MNITKIGIVLVIVALIAGASYYYYKYKPSVSFYTGPVSEREEVKFNRESENVEFAGYAFIQNYINSASPQSDPQAAQNAFSSLSQAAKTKVSPDSISLDLAAFINIQGVPDQGFSVEDLQFEGLDKAKYIIGLNYSSGRLLRAINLIKENEQWKVDSVDSLSQYP